jgi:hypothetical protein
MTAVIFAANFWDGKLAKNEHAEDDFDGRITTSTPDRD